MTLDEALGRELSAWEARGLRRRLALPAGRDFTTNDYLALSRDGRLVAAAREALERYGAGAPAARLLSGERPPHGESERAVADWLGCEASLLFPSGWQANLAVVTALAGRPDAILSDELNHASLIDACRLSRAEVRVFAHGDPESLERGLAATRRARRRLVVVESVFSMEGDLAPLAEIALACERHDAWLVVDEAHGAGLYGPEGSGRASEVDLRGRLAARILTGGKALGVAGGFAAGSRILVDWLVNRGRSFVFTTAPPPSTAAALAAAVVVRAEPWRRDRAHEAARRLREGLAASGIAAGGCGPIVPIVLGDETRALAVADRVREAGFDVRAVRPPTVPPGTSRLRVVCHADHAPGEIDGLADAIAGAVRAFPTATATPPSSPPPRPRALVVVGTDTGVGKTVVSALLVRRWSRAGGARYLKLVQTGDDCDSATVRRLTGLDERAAPEPPFRLPRPASIDQAAAAAGLALDAARIVDAARRLLADDARRPWILETAGGLLVPINDGEDQSDVLASLGLPLALVARSGLGTLNHTLLTIEAIRARGLELRALFLVGAPHDENVRTLEGRLPGLPIVRLASLDPLDARGLDSWLDAHPLPELVP